MKKILLSAMALIMSVNMFAITYTSEVTITMYDGTYFPNLILGESSDSQFAGGALVNGYYAPVQDLASAPLAVYAYYNNAEYENLVLDDLTNVPMGIKTSSATSYTLYFANQAGTFKIYDKVADQTIDCSTAYPFTIEASEVNSIINDRFVLQYVAPTPVVAICFSNNQLDITGHEGETLVITNLADDSELVNVASISANYSKNFDADALPSNTRLLVTLNGVKYRITVNPVVTPYVEPVP